MIPQQLAQLVPKLKILNPKSPQKTNPDDNRCHMLCDHSLLEQPDDVLLSPERLLCRLLHMKLTSVPRNIKSGTDAWSILASD